MPILLYHTVVTGPADPFDVFCRLQRGKFIEQMRYLADRCRLVSLPDYVTRLRQGREDKNTVTITFDDAYQGVFEHALPVLQELGAPASVFVITDTLRGDGKNLPHYDEMEMAFRITVAEALLFEPANPSEAFPLTSDPRRVEAMRQVKRRLKLLPEKERRAWHTSVLERLRVSPAACREAASKVEKLRFMTRATLERLRDAGWTLGSHSRSHRTLSQLGDEDLRAEIDGSFADMRRELGADEIAFAYPFGHPEHIGEKAPMRVAEAGYSYALAATPEEPDGDLFRIPRMDFETFRQRLD